MTNFLCRQCGSCCTGNGSVFLYPEDIKLLASHLSLSLQETVNRYTDFIMLEMVEPAGSYFYIPYLILKKDAKEQCLFLKENRCSIHAFKPVQCRETPLVEEFFTDTDWQKQVRGSCPALRSLSSPQMQELLKTPAGEAASKEHEYYRLLKENSYSLEKILGITLPEPQILSYSED